jgi:ribosomal protein L36
MEVIPSVERRCPKCKIVGREGVVYEICDNRKHNSSKEAENSLLTTVRQMLIDTKRRHLICQELQGLTCRATSGSRSV